MKILTNLRSPNDLVVGESYYRNVGVNIRRSSDDKKTVVIINTSDLDTYDTVIDPNGVLLDRYSRNNVVLINHDFSLVAGTSTVALRNGQLVAEMLDEEWDLEDEKIVPWFRKVKKGIVKGASIRFNPLEWERVETEDGKTYIRITKWELLEWSFVSVNSNPGAVVIERAEMEEQIRALQNEISELRQRLTPATETETRTVDSVSSAPQEQPQETVAEPAAPVAPEPTSIPEQPKPRVATETEVRAFAESLLPVFQTAIRRSLGKE